MHTNRIIIIVLLVLCVYLFVRGPTSTHTEVILRDTITIIDTIKEPVPIPYLVEIKEPFMIHKDSLIFIGDTLKLPKEFKSYKTDNYNLTISGFRPNLERIEIYQPNIYITEKHLIRRKWSYGVQAGYGIIINKNISTGFYLGVGVQKSF